MEKFWPLIGMLSVTLFACNKKSNETVSKVPDQSVQSFNDQQHVIIPSAISLSNTLSKLTVSLGQLEPAFNPDTTQYTLAGGETLQAKIVINAVPSNDALQVMVNGSKIRQDYTTNPLSLVAGVNTFSLDLLDGKGLVVNTYKITVKRAVELKDEYLDELVASDGDLVPAFSPEKTNYQLTVGKDTSVLSISPIASYPDAAEFEINGVKYSGDLTGYDLALIQGTQTVNIIVKGKSGRAKTYVLSIFRP